MTPCLLLRHDMPTSAHYYFHADIEPLFHYRHAIIVIIIDAAAIIDTHFDTRLSINYCSMPPPLSPLLRQRYAIRHY